MLTNKKSNYFTTKSSDKLQLNFIFVAILSACLLTACSPKKDETKATNKAPTNETSQEKNKEKSKETTILKTTTDIKTIDKPAEINPQNKTTNIQLNVANPNFDLVDKNNKASNWYFLQHAGVVGYEAKLDTTQHVSGKQSMSITQIEPQVYGLIEQRLSIPEITQTDKADKILGTINYSAQIKTANVGADGAFLSINFLNKAGEIISQVRSDKVIGTTNWTELSLKKPVPDHTKYAKISVILMDKGTVWIDDVKASIQF